jgi:DNA-binding winged helix-turn-helix (wHTH) protein
MNAKAAPARRVWAFRGVEIDEDLCEVRRLGESQQPQRLTFDLLVYLARNSWRVVTRGELLERVWLGTHVGDAAVSQAILQARKVLGPQASLLRTVRGRGYQLAGFSFMEPEPLPADTRRFAPLLEARPSHEHSGDGGWPARGFARPS